MKQHAQPLREYHACPKSNEKHSIHPYRHNKPDMRIFGQHVQALLID